MIVKMTQIFKKLLINEQKIVVKLCKRQNIIVTT